MLYVLMNSEGRLFTGMGRIAGMSGYAHFKMPTKNDPVQVVTYSTREAAEAGRDYVTRCGYPCTVAVLVIKE